MSRTATLALLLLWLSLTASAYAQARSEVEGTWFGRLQAGAYSVRIVFNISADEAGRLTATLDSPDQGATGIPASAVTLEDDSLRIEVAVIRGVFGGTLADGGTRLAGIWSQQGGNTLPLEMTRVSVTEAIGPPSRPQEPQPPFSYAVEEVTIRTRSNEVRLAGTLTIPQGQGPFPGVVLISGSGPQDRDETIFGHRPFLVLADHLGRQGIAVLRYDDRGVGASTGDFADATSTDFAQDAAAALRFLQSRREVDPGRTGLVGHSEGGLIAPLVAAVSDVAFIVLLAPPGVIGEDILYDQSARLMQASGSAQEEVQANRALQERLFGILKSLPTERMDRSQISYTLIESRLVYILTENGVPREAAEAQASQLISPWFRQFLVYDPRPALAALDVPVLALYGEKDLQVAPELNAPQVEAALEAGNAEYAVRVIPNLNHLFQTADTGGTSEYGQIEETFSPVALEAISDWIREQAE
jgi:uncharacterized protein